MFNKIKEPFNQKAKHLFNKLVHRVENKTRPAFNNVKPKDWYFVRD